MLDFKLSFSFSLCQAKEVSMKAEAFKLLPNTSFSQVLLILS